MKTLEFYFDFVSPYAYFSWLRVQRFSEAHDLQLVPKPVVFGKLLDHWGQLGPAEIAPKREWLIRYCLYYSHKNNIPLSFPKYHPFNPLPALRLSLPEVSKEQQSEVITQVFKCCWVEGGDIGDLECVLSVAERSGLPRKQTENLLHDKAIHQLLRNNTTEAVVKGVFGVPTMVLDSTLYWGNDQFDCMEQVITGGYESNQDLQSELLNRARSADREKHRLS